MFWLFRMALILGVILALLPSGGSKQIAATPRANVGASDAVTAASATVSDMWNFCTRQPQQARPLSPAVNDFPGCGAAEASSEHNCGRHGRAASGRLPDPLAAFFFSSRSGAVTRPAPGPISGMRVEGTRAILRLRFAIHDDRRHHRELLLPRRLG